MNIDKNTLLLLVSLVALLLCFASMRSGKRGKGKLTVDKSGFFKYHKETIFNSRPAWGEVVSERNFAELSKEDKKTAKAERKKDTPNKSKKPEKPLLVLNFNGDIKAKQHRSFAKQVDEAVLNKDSLSEVVVVITSPGGMVSQYGHVFSQMERLRDAFPKLTVCIDVVAASGGYLMSLPAHKILAAPFATVGSVGVVAFVPNLRNFLLKFKIEPRTFTVGKYKRTVGMFDKASKEEVQHFESQLESVQRAFLGTLKKYRPQANFPKIETGSHWSAQESVELNLGLVDGLGCSEEYILESNKERSVVELSQKRSLMDDGIFSLVNSLVSAVEARLVRFV